MKKLLVLAIVLLVAVLMALTVPDKEAHKEAMMIRMSSAVDISRPPLKSHDCGLWQPGHL